MLDSQILFQTFSLETHASGDTLKPQTQPIGVCLQFGRHVDIRGAHVLGVF
jgi:hypothetical protein